MCVDCGGYLIMVCTPKFTKKSKKKHRKLGKIKRNPDYSAVFVNISLV